MPVCVTEESAMEFLAVIHIGVVSRVSICNPLNHTAPSLSLSPQSVVGVARELAGGS